jgi:hypothetical protein
VISLLETVAEPFRQWLLVQMEELFTLNVQPVNDTGREHVVLSDTDFPVGECDEVFSIQIIKGDREIKFKGDLDAACSVYNISDIRYVLDEETPLRWSHAIPEITKPLGKWWFVDLDEVRELRCWYLVNFVDRLVFLGDEGRIVKFKTILVDSQLKMGIMDEIIQVPSVKPVSRRRVPARFEWY